MILGWMVGAPHVDCPAGRYALQKVSLMNARSAQNWSQDETKQGACSECAIGGFSVPIGFCRCRARWWMHHMQGLSLIPMHLQVFDECTQCPQTGLKMRLSRGHALVCDRAIFSVPSGFCRCRARWWVNTCKDCPSGRFTPEQKRMMIKECPQGWFQGDAAQGSCKDVQ